jgi:rhodanese-related sulfurtransferase
MLIFGLTTGFNSKADQEGPVNITSDVPFVDVKHKGKIVRIQRVQENDNLIDPDYAQTSRPCPPYCIQPMQLAAGVETIGELELLQYLVSKSKKGNVLVIDSREPEWLLNGMIPGAVNIPWTKLFNKTASDKEIADILEFQFGATWTGRLWNFEGAKTLVFYCNGPWCGQSPTNIRALLSLGYPAHLIKWYRGGMQSWKQFGLTTVKP